MKRIYIAILFICIVLIVGSAETGFITAKADMFIDKISNADRLIQKSNYRDALDICKKTEKDWYDSAKPINMLLIHDYVDSIGIRISRMTSFAESKNYDMYFAESTQAKKELASIKESEYPLIENLL